MWKVALTNPIAATALDLLRTRAEVRIAPTPTPHDILRTAENCDGIVVRAQLPDGIFEHCPALRAAVRHGVGVDFIPIEQATAHGVQVANVPGVNADSVAQHATMLMLGLARRGFAVVDTLRREGWDAARSLGAGAREVQGCCVGIVGFGNVGRRLGRLWHTAFGARVLVSTEGPVDEPWAMAVSLDELAAACDFLVLCCPLTPATRGLVDERLLGRMASDAFLVNVARGGVVQEAALLQALRERRIAGAALDVYPSHPLPADSPWLGLDNVICTPHCAGLSSAALEHMGRGAVEELFRILDGHAPLHPINHVPAGARRGASQEKTS
jgi:D-3-phosphoglycerate dehydrogenase